MDDSGAVEAGGTAGPGVALTDEAIPERGFAAFVAEFIGTLALVFFITLVVSLFVLPPVSPGPGIAPQQPFIDYAVIGLVHVLALFMLVQTLAVISGAHVNPAVTVALAAIRQIRWVDAAIYIVCQVAGGILGAALSRLILSDTGKAIHYGALQISTAYLKHTIWRGMLIEGVGTFFLVWAIVGVAVHPQAVKAWAGLVIGGTLGLIVMVGGPLDGGGFNPARALGPSIVSGHFDGFGRFLLAFIAAPLIGGVAAAFSYMYLFILPGKKGPFGMRPVG